MYNIIRVHSSGTSAFFLFYFFFFFDATPTDCTQSGSNPPWWRVPLGPSWLHSKPPLWQPADGTLVGTSQGGGAPPGIYYHAPSRRSSFNVCPRSLVHLTVRYAAVCTVMLTYELFWMMDLEASSVRSLALLYIAT
jgi:hypothetical protein